jgi:putative ABC transport system substrate-binding protein
MRRRKFIALLARVALLPTHTGLVPSLAHPGGNITGVSVDPGLEIWGKRFQLLRQVISTISKVGILALRQNPERAAVLQVAEEAGIPVFIY